MIAMKSNPRPYYCIERHHCGFEKKGKCQIRCGPNDFIKGDKHLSPWPAETRAVDIPLYLRREPD